MNIVVLGGSPKGAKSVTMQYVNYLKSTTDEHTFVEHYVAQSIRSIEKDDTLLEQIAQDVAKADAVLWAFPLYFGLVHGSYKRFVEIVWERDIAEAFAGKHCAILATSIHFFDHTATEYIRGISEDLGMSVDEVYSPAMDDLFSPDGKKQCKLFLEQWTKKVKENVRTGRLSLPLNHHSLNLRFEDKPVTPRAGVKVGLVTESGVSKNLDIMVSEMAKEFANIELYDLSKMKIAGSCLGCLKCGYENKCVYEGKDDVIKTYRELKDCDVIIFAGTIKDRYLSARWKTFIDRLFFTTHIPFFDRKVIGFIISGPLSQIPNLRELLTGFFEADGLVIGGIVTDESLDAQENIHGLATTLESYSKSGYQPPRQFLGEAGHRIFRDEIFGGLKGVFVADHKYYKKNGLYDFPQNNWKKRLQTNFMYLAMKLPFFRKEVQTNMTDYMVKPYENVIKNESIRD